MSRTVSLSCVDDGEYQLTIDLSARFRLTELRIRPASNWKYPHEVMCKGGASVILDSKECAILIAEWMRYTFFQDDGVTNHVQGDTSFEFRAALTPHEVKRRADMTKDNWPGE